MKTKKGANRGLAVNGSTASTAARNGLIDPMDNPNIANSLANIVTMKQLGMIRAICRYAKIDKEKECQSLMRCQTEELSKRAASDFLQHLQKMVAEIEEHGEGRK